MFKKFELPLLDEKKKKKNYAVELEWKQLKHNFLKILVLKLFHLAKLEQFRTRFIICTVL